MRKKKIILVSASIISLLFMICAFFYIYGGDLADRLGLVYHPEVKSTVTATTNLNTSKIINSSNDDQKSKADAAKQAQLNAAYMQSLQDENNIEKARINKRLGSSQGDDGAVFLTDKLLKYGALTNDESNQSHTIPNDTKASCFTCPTLSDETIESKVQAALDKLKKQGLISTKADNDKKLKAVLTDDGKVALLDGIPVFTDGDIIIDPMTGEPITREGRILTPDSLRNDSSIILTARDGSKYLADGTSLSPIAISDSDLKGLKYNDKDVYLDKHGQMRYANGDPVLDKDNNPIFYDKKLGFINSDGKASNLGNSLRNAKGEVLEGNKKYVATPNVSGKDLTSKQLKGMKYKNNEVFVGKDGKLYYMDGSDVLDENQKPIYYDSKKGFVNAFGKPSVLRKNLVTGDGEIIDQSASNISNNDNYQEMSTQQAKLMALQLSNQNKENILKSRVNSADVATQTSIQSSNKKPQKLGMFLVDNDGNLLSNDLEPLTLDSKLSRLDKQRHIISTDVTWSEKFSGFVSKSHPLLIFESQKTKRHYDFQGKELSIDKVLFSLNKDRELNTINSKAFYDGEGVIVNKNNELYTESGKKILSPTGKHVLFSPQIGLYVTTSSENLDGLLSDKEAIALGEKGNQVNEKTKQFQIISDLKSLTYLPNGILLSSHRPIYDSHHDKLLVKPDTIGNTKVIRIVSTKDLPFDELNVKPNGKKLVLYKGVSPISPAQVSVYDVYGNPVRLVASVVDFEILKTGLFVSEDGFVFSDSEAGNLALSSDFKPLTFKRGKLLNGNLLYTPVRGVSEDSKERNVLLNIDGWPLLDAKGLPVPLGDFSSFSKFDGDETYQLFPNLSKTPNYLISEDIRKAAKSASGFLFYRNTQLRSALGRPLQYKEGELLATDSKFLDATSKDHTDVVIYHQYLSDGKRLLSDKDGALEASRYRIKNGRLLMNGSVVLRPRAELVSYLQPIISNGKVINFKYTNHEHAVGDLSVVDGLLTDSNGNLVYQNGRPTKVNKDGSITDAITGAELRGSNGALYLDKDLGFVDNRRRTNRVDYLNTLDGSYISSDAKKVKNNSNLKRRTGFGEFLFDDVNRVYTKDKKPVVVDGSQIKLADTGNGVLTKDGPLKYDDSNVLFSDKGFVKKDGDSLGLKINPSGDVVSVDDFSNIGQLLNDMYKKSQSGFDRIKNSVSSDVIRPADSANNDQQEVATNSNNENNTYIAQEESYSQKEKGRTSKLDMAPILPLHSRLSMADIQGLNGYTLAEIQSDIKRYKNIVNADFAYNVSRSSFASSSQTSSQTSSDKNIVASDKNIVASEQDGKSNSGEAADKNKGKGDSFQYASVTLVPDDAVLLFKKGTRLTARISAPYTTGSSAQKEFMPAAILTSGETAGAMLTGQNIVVSNDDLTLIFGQTIVLKNGTRIKAPDTFAISINPKTGFAGTGAEVDDHFWEKLFKVGSLAMLTKAGEFVELTKQTTTSSATTSSSTTTTSASVPTPEELALIVGGAAAKEGLTVVQSQLSSITKELKLWQGQRIQIAITQDIYVKRSDIDTY